MMPLADFDAAVGVLFGHLVALALAMARPAAMLMTFPVFTRLGLTGLIRNAFVAALALPLVPDLAAALPPISTATLRLAALAGKEAVIGALLGVLLGVPFWAAEVAGDLIDYERQAPDVQLQDPNAMTVATASGTLFIITAVVLFVAADGLGSMAASLYDSYALWPLMDLAPKLQTGAGLLALQLLDRAMRLALIMAFPALLAMFVAMLALMITARFAPQMNVFDLSMAARNLVFFVIMPLYAVFLIDQFGSELGRLPGVVTELRRFLP